MVHSAPQLSMAVWLAKFYSQKNWRFFSQLNSVSLLLYSIWITYLQNRATMCIVILRYGYMWDIRTFFVLIIKEKYTYKYNDEVMIPLVTPCLLVWMWTHLLTQSNTMYGWCCYIPQKCQILVKSLFIYICQLMRHNLPNNWKFGPHFDKFTSHC